MRFALLVVLACLGCGSEKLISVDGERLAIQQHWNQGLDDYAPRPFLILDKKTGSEYLVVCYRGQGIAVTPLLPQK